MADLFKLWSMKSFVENIVERDGLSIKKVSSPNLKNNRKIVVSAVKQNGKALIFVLEEFKNDREIVLIAISQDAEFLLFASNELKSDREIVMFAIQKSVKALRLASDELRKDREIVMFAVKKDIEALQYVSKELESDREFTQMLSQYFGKEVVCFACEDLKADEGIVVVNQNGNVLEEFQQDTEIVKLVT